MEDDSELDAGYAGTDAAEKPLVESLVEDTPEAPMPEAPEPKADPLLEMRELIEKQNARIRNTEGHIGGLNHNLKQMQETLAASKAASQQVSDAPTQAQVQEAMSNPKEWDDLKADFPEWSVATEKFMDARLAKVGKSDPQELLKVRTELQAQFQQTRKDSIDATLDAVIPEWDAEVKTPAFGKWMDAQTDAVKALGSSHNIRDAAKMLRLYATHRAKAPEPRQEQKSNVAARQKRIEAAVTPKGTGGYSQSQTAVDEFESGYSGR